VIALCIVCFCVGFGCGAALAFWLINRRLARMEKETQ